MLAFGGAQYAQTHEAPFSLSAQVPASRKSAMKARVDQDRRGNDEIFRSWFEHNPLPMWVFDSETFAFLAVNAAAIRHYGYSRDEFLAMTIKDIRPPEDIPRLIEFMKAPYEDRTQIATARHRTRDGHLLDVEVYAQQGIWTSGYAELIQVRDATELKRAEGRLAERSAYLNALIENSPVAIVALDSHERLTLCNPAFELLFQYQESQIVGTRAYELIVPAELAQEAAEITRRVLSGDTVHALTRRQRRDRTLVDVDLYGVPLMVGGMQLGIFWLYQDVSERKRAEEALRSLSGRLLQLQDEERRRMARELHDAVGQSLTALSANLAVINNSTETLNQKARKALLECLSLAEQACKEIRTFSYLLHPPMLDEEGLAIALALYVEGFAERSGIHVHLELHPGLGRLPQELETTLFRIVQEALTNVHRHSESLTAEVRLARGPSGLILEVRDQGRGIESEVLERVRRRGAGLGVGINGMRERVTQLGGQLEVDSTERGTVLRAVLPVAIGAP
jgi:two-component system, NarL family, sensor kinase